MWGLQGWWRDEGGGGAHRPMEDVWVEGAHEPARARHVEAIAAAHAVEQVGEGGARRCTHGGMHVRPFATPGVVRPRKRGSCEGRAGRGASCATVSWAGMGLRQDRVTRSCCGVQAHTLRLESMYSEGDVRRRHPSEARAAPHVMVGFGARCVRNRHVDAALSNPMGQHGIAECRCE